MVATVMLLEDFPSREDDGKRIAELKDTVVDMALVWHSAERGTEEEKDASINLCWACGMLKDAQGEDG